MLECSRQALSLFIDHLLDNFVDVSGRYAIFHRDNLEWYVSLIFMHEFQLFSTCFVMGVGDWETEIRWRNEANSVEFGTKNVMKIFLFLVFSLDFSMTIFLSLSIWTPLWLPPWHLAHPHHTAFILRLFAPLCYFKIYKTFWETKKQIAI